MVFLGSIFNFENLALVVALRLSIHGIWGNFVCLLFLWAMPSDLPAPSLVRDIEYFGELMSDDC
jgi:hypothetical protein